MTNEELDKLDRLAAEKIMNWMPNADNIYRRKEDAGYFHWQPSRNIAQAWELLEKLRPLLHFRLECRGTDFKNWICRVSPVNEDVAIGTCVEAETAPLIITLACLKAIEGVKSE